MKKDKDLCLEKVQLFKCKKKKKNHNFTSTIDGTGSSKSVKK